MQSINSLIITRRLLPAKISKYFGRENIGNRLQVCKIKKIKKKSYQYYSNYLFPEEGIVKLNDSNPARPPSAIPWISTIYFPGTSEV